MVIVKETLLGSRLWKAQRRPLGGENEHETERSREVVLLTLTTVARANAREPSQHSANNQTWSSLMSTEFEKLAALLDLSGPSECDPQVDRDEAAKLAARWGWLVRRARERQEAQSRLPGGATS